MDRCQTFQHRNDDLAALKLRDSHHFDSFPQGVKRYGDSLVKRSRIEFAWDLVGFFLCFLNDFSRKKKPQCINVKVDYYL